MVANKRPLKFGLCKSGNSRHSVNRASYAVHILPDKKWQGMVFMIIMLLPASTYFSLNCALLQPTWPAILAASDSVTLIMSCRQQAPHFVQSICGLIAEFRRCTIRSISVPSLRAIKVRKARFSSSRSVADAAIRSLFVSKKIVLLLAKVVMPV